MALFRYLEGQGREPWGLEQWELCEAYLDYLGAIQFINAYHNLFSRRTPEWLQVFNVSIYSRPDLTWV
jgi:hypothetical protein